MRRGWLCLIPFAFGACQQPPAIRLAQFSQAAAYPSLLGPVGDLRNPHSSLYLMGWPQEPGELPVAPARARVRLFCTRPQPAQLVLVGCSEEGEVVDVRLGSHLLGRVQMSVPWRRYTLEVPESALVAGENLLLLEGGGPAPPGPACCFARPRGPNISQDTHRGLNFARVTCCCPLVPHWSFRWNSSASPASRLTVLCPGAKPVLLPPNRPGCRRRPARAFPSGALSRH